MADLETAKERIINRAQHPMELTLDLDFLSRLKSNYDLVADKYNMLKIDTSNKTPDALVDEILSLIV